MFKKLFFVASIACLSFQSFAQSKTTRYIQVNAVVDAVGKIIFRPIEGSLKEKAADSLIDYSSLDKIVLKSKSAIQGINALTELGWTLVSVVEIGKDKDRGVSGSYLAYYFKREW